MNKMEKIIEKIFVFQATKTKRGDYEHFGIRKKLASMYGKNPEDVCTIKMKISEDQTIPPAPQNTPEHLRNKADYWGFYDYEKNEFGLIYPKRFLLDMCFPSGLQVMEDIKQGKAYRLEIIK